MQNEAYKICRPLNSVPVGATFRLSAEKLGNGRTYKMKRRLQSNRGETQEIWGWMRPAAASLAFLPKVLICTGSK